jgi:peptidyl-prolyl cis-trans isomerase C
MNDIKLTRPRLLSASHILVRHEYEAKDLLKKLDEGHEFGKLAEDFSTCSSSKHRGFLGIFAPRQMVPAFEQALLLLKEGEITKKPVKTQFGFHIIRRESV